MCFYLFVLFVCFYCFIMLVLLLLFLADTGISIDKQLLIAYTLTWVEDADRSMCDGEKCMWWAKHHGLGVIRINHKAGPVIFQNFGPDRGNGVTALRYINQVLRLHIVPILAVTSSICSSRTMPAPSLPEPRETFSSSTTSKLCHDLLSIQI